MGQLIAFYVPAMFVYRRWKWIAESERGKVLVFNTRKSA